VFDNYYFKIKVLRMEKLWKTYKANKRKFKKRGSYLAIPNREYKELR